MGGGKVGSVEWMQQRLPVFYLVFALLLTTVMCWVTPPFFGPDEPSQSLRALALLQGDLLPKMGANEAGADVDTGALQAMDGMDAIRMRWEKQSADFHDRAYGPVTAASQARFARCAVVGAEEICRVREYSDLSAGAVPAGDRRMEDCAGGEADDLRKPPAGAVVDRDDGRVRGVVGTAVVRSRSVESAGGAAAAECAVSAGDRLARCTDAARWRRWL